MGPGVESLKVHHLVSVFNAKGPPVPIPNTEVKLCSAENTCLETDREDRSTLTQKSIREGEARVCEANLPFALANMESVILTQRVHPFPFRTRKLSFAVPKILVWRRTGKIGHSRHIRDIPKCISLCYSSLAQAVERMTVNHDVAGSSPAGGAKTK